MPGFRSRILEAYLAPLTPTQRGTAEAFIAGSLRDLPHHLRIGLAADSILLEAITRATHGGRIPDDATLRELVTRWEANPFTPIRQYARLVTSLVLFADQETTPPGTVEDVDGGAP